MRASCSADSSAAKYCHRVLLSFSLGPSALLLLLLVSSNIDSEFSKARSAGTYSAGAGPVRATPTDTTLMADNLSEHSLLELTAQIVAAYIGNNSVPSGEIANLIG